MKAIDWDRVDALIVVSPKFEEIVQTKISADVPIHIVYNGIDLARFPLQESGHFEDDVIAYVGYLNKKKGPTLLRTIMASFPKKNFHVAGQHQDAQVQLYLEDLDLPNVTYHGWVDTAEFLRSTRARYIMSTSVTESFGMSIGEGMAMGLTPLVHAWPGATDLWPEGQVWATFLDLALAANRIIKPENARAYVAARYTMGTCIGKVIELLQCD
jgi:glycosyltransferase involved in cell wall biosynthesis